MPASAQEKLEKKLKRRDTLINSIRSISDSANNLILEIDISKTLDDELVALRDTVLEKVNKIKGLDEEIIDLIEQADPDKLDDEEDFSTKFMIYSKSALRKMNKCIEKFSMEKMETASTVYTSSSHSATGIRLPKIAIKPFDGNIEKWHEFWDSFEHAVHVSDISNIQKMTYLKTLLSGQAESTISGFKLSDGNYELAVALLKERYDNKQLLISSHMNKLLKLEPIVTLDDIEPLRTLYNQVETQIRSLENLGIDSKNYGPLLIPVLMSKVPPGLNLIISRKFTDNDSWDISLVLKELKAELFAREKVGCNMVTDPDDKISAYSLHAGNARFNNHKQKLTEFSVRICIFCGKEHKPQQCQIVTNLDARKAILREKKKCFVCLKGGHIAQKCTSQIKCYHCSSRHHAAMCNKEGLKDRPSYRPKDSTTHNGVSSISSASVLLQTATVEVGDHKVSSPARILFDSGSQLSYITPELRNRLKLKTVSSREICIKTFGSHITKETLECVIVPIKTLVGSYIFVECYVKDICHPLTAQNTKLAVESYPHLRNLLLADFNRGTDINIDILIGSDFYWLIIEDEIIRGSVNQPVALASKVGYILSGPVNHVRSSAIMISHVLKCQTEINDNDSLLNEKLDKFWALESLDVEAETDVHSDFCHDLKFNSTEGKYCVHLPFKTHDTLPDNFTHCQQRLKGLQKKFRVNDDLLHSYRAIIKEQLQSGIIEPIQSQPCHNPDPGQVHYLPHRPVIRNDKATTKVRMVFDASSKTRGPSLNECLYSGPSLTESLFGVLLRFRLYKYAFTADIEKAFLQILLSEDHRDYVRFLWYKDNDNLSSESIDTAEVIAYRVCRVLFGLTSSPFHLSATLIEHFQQLIDERFVQKVLSSLQVDDLISGGHSIQEAHDFYIKVKNHLATASFNLRKFTSNSLELNQLVNENELSEPTLKVLGIMWDRQADHLAFSFDHLRPLAVEVPTKRQLLIFMASIYDPLGLLNPCIVKLKILFQQVCKAKIPWDNVLKEDVLLEWTHLRDDLFRCPKFTVNRWINFMMQSKTVEIHGFCDASLKAYGACVYAKVINPQGEISSSLLTSKSKVAPLKGLTVPRLELCAAVLCAELVARVVHELSPLIPVLSFHCWSDSTIVLHWLRGNGKGVTGFVARRVEKICALISEVHWFHIDTAINPSDILSRGATLFQLVNNSLWLHGPKVILSPNLDMNKFKLVSKLTEVSSLAADSEKKEIRSLTALRNIIDSTRFNNYTRLISVTAYVLRFIDNLKGKVQKQPTITRPTLHVDERRRAETLWIQDVQNEFELSKNFTQLTKDLRLKDHDGVLRCQGRLENAPISFDSKFPVFLPKCHIAALLVNHYHEIVKHNGVKETLNELRTKYWIPKARKFVQSVIHKCRTCKLIEGKPYVYPDAPSLPAARLSMSPAFTHTAIDYAGPLHVKNIYAGSHTTFKAWIFLYTCSSTRSICLDIVPDYSSTSCVKSLKRFFSRRGVPESILSDNGSNFTSDETQQFASTRGISWQFNPPASPWWGGVFERLIRCTKRCLKKVITNAKLTYEEMLTVLYEIEIILNNRPLTYTYETPGDEVLTPNHLVFGRRLNLHANIKSEMSVTVKVRHEYIEQIIQHFWTRWRTEYVIELREKHKERVSRFTRNKICNVGDIVQIHEDKAPRISYKVGVIEEFKKSRDGARRIAIVRYKQDGKTLRLERPINKLYPIEVNELTEEDSAEDNEIELQFIDDRGVEIF